MGVADENLRKGRTGAGTVIHLLAQARIGGDAKFGVAGVLARQQRLGGAAVAAARTGIDFDRGGHDALSRAPDSRLLSNKPRIIWGFAGRPQPAQTPARRRWRLSRA